MVNGRQRKYPKGNIIPFECTRKCTCKCVYNHPNILNIIFKLYFSHSMCIELIYEVISFRTRKHVLRVKNVVNILSIICSPHSNVKPSLHLTNLNAV